MKLIGITCSVEVKEKINERRDILDQKWALFLQTCGFQLIMLPTHWENTQQLLENIPISGIILSGGNTLSSYGGDAPERDEFENKLIEKSIVNKIPILGICRGMQILVHHFQGKLEPVINHVGVSHLIIWKNGHKEWVNSYHAFGSYTLPLPFEILAQTYEGVVEAMFHPFFSILGIMWHPERIFPFRSQDINLFQKHFANA